MPNVIFGIFALALLAAFMFEWRWRKAAMVHEVFHMALEAGAPIEEPHDILTNYWFWLRNMAVGCNVVLICTWFSWFSPDPWIITGKVVLTASVCLTITRIWVGTKCNRRPTRKKLRARVKEWAKAHRPHLAPVRRPVPAH